MDRLIKRWTAARDSDLRLCEAHGVAYQKDMHSGRVPYDAKYLEKCAAYDGSSIAKAVNSGRVALLARNLAEGATVLDIGAGSGAFVRDASALGFNAHGFDVIPEVADRLRADGKFSDDVAAFDAVTMWDAIEHMDNPETWLSRIAKGARLFVSVPVFTDLKRIRESKHYRPGEHLYYWTAQGFTDWMALYGFRLLETSTHETDAGRESIVAFAFIKDLPDYNDHIAAYQEIHATRFYGSSATELHLGSAAHVVAKLQPISILDYGCGRGDLLAHFWRDGKRRIERYDPAIPRFKQMPYGRFDLIFCNDVMEHIPMADVDRVLAEIKTKGSRVFFTISTKLAKARMPDGSNAHCTLLTREEWKRWIGDYFGNVRDMPSHWDHELILVAGEQ
jgi:2-polyprenyl-3-methyl-5-hydroxy-6-metoxy-1,4-benzoquinol methylase